MHTTVHLMDYLELHYEHVSNIVHNFFVNALQLIQQKK